MVIAKENTRTRSKNYIIRICQRVSQKADKIIYKYSLQFYNNVVVVVVLWQEEKHEGGVFFFVGFIFCGSTIKLDGHRFCC